MGIDVFWKHPQVLLLVVVFCCPLIPAGGWCWLRCLEGCLECMKTIVQRLRTLAYAPMYIALMSLLSFGATVTYMDLQESTKKDRGYEYIMYAVTAIFAFISIVMSVVTTVNHVRKGWLMHEQRERVIYIIALPGFYGLMCYLCAEQYIELDLDTVGKHWALPHDSEDVKTKFTHSMDQLFFATGNVFEAFSLVFFANLTMEALRRASKLKVSIASPGRSCSDSRAKRMHRCMQGWVMFPIFCFSTVLFVEATYRLVTVLLEYFNFGVLIPPVIMQWFDQMPDISQEDGRCTSYCIAFAVMRCICLFLSFLALVIIDKTFYKELTAVGFATKRRPRAFSNMKFWGVMSFVVLEVALRFGLDLVPTEQLGWNKKRLISALTLSFVCLVVSFVNYYAFPPTGLWLDDLTDDQLEKLPVELSVSDLMTELVRNEDSPRSQGGGESRVTISSKPAPQPSEEAGTSHVPGSPREPDPEALTVPETTPAGPASRSINKPALDVWGLVVQEVKSVHESSALQAST